MTGGIKTCKNAGKEKFDEREGNRWDGEKLAKPPETIESIRGEKTGEEQEMKMGGRWNKIYKKQKWRTGEKGKWDSGKSLTTERKW